MKSTFIHIDTAVMIGQLHLKGYELLVYALVSGLSKGGSEWVKKPLQWYADTLNIEKGWLSKSFGNLVEKGLLEKTQNGTKKYYRVSCRNYNKEVVETTTNSCRNYNKEVVETTTNTLYNNNKNNTKNNNSAISRAREGEKEKNYSENSVPSDHTDPSPNPLPSRTDAVVVKRVQEWETEHRAMVANASEWANSIYRLYKISPLELNDYLTQFTDHCTSQGQDTKTLADYRHHLSSWLRYRVNEQKHNPNGQSTTQQRQHVTHYDGPADFSL